ncbi:hypothetical protein [Microbacterium thalli]|uniref:hypothetical protein n=1 Tax=Microbacterium thalli TaxID=3027921 RepID=UPI0023671210|nr:hypothetical protein [Microbacterium thalli]MDD7929879.1 hypothetical protein [Microbacterium thalli]
MSDELDLDALVAGGALDSQEERRRQRLQTLAVVADHAFRTDVSYSIDMAKAGWEAVEGRAARAKAAKARAARRRMSRGAL